MKMITDAEGFNILKYESLSFFVKQSGD